MDLKELRDRALEATTRFFVDRDGILPDQEGEEWEAEYQRFLPEPSGCRCNAPNLRRHPFIFRRRLERADKDPRRP
jgi:hypothetical protein